MPWFQFSGLWRHPNFMRLWTGQTVSAFGSAVTELALPLVAVVTLHATPLQMGVLVAVERAPFLVLSLFAGVWIDRHSPRPTLIAADLGRAVSLGSISLASAAGVLGIGYLYVIALLVGILTVFFDIAYYSFLPALVAREQLVEGNTKLSITESVASVAGPSLAGAVIQLLSAPVAILADAVSFLVSAISLLLIRLPRLAVHEVEERQSVWREIGDGLGIVLGNPLLRPITACGAIHNFTANMLYALFVLYLSRLLGLSPALIGAVFAAGSAGSLLGASIGGRVGARLGVGPTIGLMQLFTATGGVFFALAGGPTWLAVGSVATGQFIWGASRPIYNITQVSLRQAITPERLLGRMTASMRFITWGVTPIGALTGGVLGATIGIRPTLVVVVAGETLAAAWAIFSPLWKVHDVPPVESTAATP